MAFPLIGLIPKLITPAAKLIGINLDGTSTEGDSPLTKTWRPFTIAAFVLLIAVSFFTGYELSDGLLTVIGAVIVTYMGGRSLEKRGVKKVIEILKDNEDDKRKQAAKK